MRHSKPPFVECDICQTCLFYHSYSALLSFLLTYLSFCIYINFFGWVNLTVGNRLRYIQFVGTGYRCTKGRSQYSCKYSIVHFYPASIYQSGLFCQSLWTLFQLISSFLWFPVLSFQWNFHSKVIQNPRWKKCKCPYVCTLHSNQFYSSSMLAVSQGII